MTVRRAEFMELKWEVERQRLLIMELRQGTSSHHKDCEEWQRDWRERAHGAEAALEDAYGAVEGLRALANAVSDYLKWAPKARSPEANLLALGKALAAAADTLGAIDYPGRCKLCGAVSMVNDDGHCERCAVIAGRWATPAHIDGSVRDEEALCP